MPATYEPIATTTLNSTSATITFSSIPATYTDLRVVLVCTTNLTAFPTIRFNSDTATNYSQTGLEGNGSSATSSRATNQTGIFVAYNASTSLTIPTAYTVDVFSYAGSTNKTALIANAANKNDSGYIERIVGLWRSTSAINAITFTVVSREFSVGTTATIYGIKAA